MRMKVALVGVETLQLEVGVVQRGPIAIKKKAPLHPPFWNTTFKATGWFPNMKVVLKRVDGLDQEGNEGKPVQVR